MNGTAEPIVNSISSLKSWEILKQEKDSCLVDVRSSQEWNSSGIPDLSTIKKEVKLITLIDFIPTPHENENFASELEKLAPKKNAKLFFICKAGGRSLKAAKIALNLGYQNCFNIVDGFEGNVVDANSVPLNINGWVNNNLPRKTL